MLKEITCPVPIPRYEVSANAHLKAEDTELGKSLPVQLLM